MSKSKSLIWKMKDFAKVIISKQKQKRKKAKIMKRTINDKTITLTFNLIASQKEEGWLFESKEEENYFKDTQIDLIWQGYELTTEVVHDIYNDVHEMRLEYDKEPKCQYRGD